MSPLIPQFKQGSGKGGEMCKTTKIIYWKYLGLTLQLNYIELNIRLELQAVSTPLCYIKMDREGVLSL